jgi:hypothetical protein
VSREIATRYPSAGEAAVGLAQALGVRMGPLVSSASFPAASPTGAMVGSRPSFDIIEAQPAPVDASNGVVAFAPSPSPEAVRRKSPIVPLAVSALAAVVVGISVYLMVVRDRPGGLVSASSAAVSIPAVVDAGVTPAAGPMPSPDDSGRLVAVTAPEPQGTARSGSRAKPKPSEPSVKPQGTKDPAKEEPAPLTREQRQRLESLQRLCDQGTFTATECNAKRQAILHGGR